MARLTAGHAWVARLRLLAQHLSRSKLADPADVVAAMTAMQAQDHAGARWSVAQRLTTVPAASVVDRAFDDGRILRTHVLRPTWHYVAAPDLRWLMRLRGPGLDAANARRYRELGLDTRTLRRANGAIAEAVAHTPRTRRELAAVLEHAGIDIAEQRLTFVLMHAELTSVVCSGPMNGKQHTYAAFDSRVPPDAGPADDEALAELARRYFRSRGPVTVADFSWWSGLSMRDARAGLDLVQSELESRQIDDRTYWLDPQLSGSERGTSNASDVTLAPCFDEVVVSYSQSRDAIQGDGEPVPLLTYVDGYRHVVLADGRVIGHWRPTGRTPHAVETRLTVTLDAPGRRSLEDAIARYRRFEGGAPHPGPPGQARRRGR